MDLCYNQPGGGGTRLYLPSVQVRAPEVASTASANGRIADVVVPVCGGQLAGDHRAAVIGLCSPEHGLRVTEYAPNWPP
ncbi:MAG: hypothetical protein QOG73_4782 [Acetobacteraceae bacterium]|jgi:hypothetical protein|nr:hypothetical protein [Acetobacteraceae bacterium]